MSNYPMKIWVINEDEFEAFTYTGGKVIYIAEDLSTRYATHPALITAGSLLSPIEAIQAELDGDLMTSNEIYEQYLESEEANQYVSIIVAAAIQQIPIGIMFGRDEMEMQFPKMFIDHMYKCYGLVFGINGKIDPCILEEYIPVDLCKLYNMNIIDVQTFMMKHPPLLPIFEGAIPKLIYELNPPVKDKDFFHYAEYFENMKKAIYEGGKFLIDPFVGL